jgi:hypothetical protein
MKLYIIVFKGTSYFIFLAILLLLLLFLNTPICTSTHLSPALSVLTFFP